MGEVVMSNLAEFEKLKEEFQRGGANGLHIVSDFERTLTCAFMEEEGQKVVSSLLRAGGDYLGKNYVKKARALFDEYHPIEIDPKVPIEEKEKAMEEWWLTHFDLLIKSGFNKKHLEKAIKLGNVKLRKGAQEFFDLLNRFEIPLVIMSASGLGKDAISMFLQKEGKLFPNIYIISNSFEWDGSENVVGVKKPIIHSLNKDETIIKDFPSIYSNVKERKNVILLGDNLEDVGMIEGFAFDYLIKIGFLNENIEENLEEYKKVYDVLVLNDSSIEFVNTLLKEIIF